MAPPNNVTVNNFLTDYVRGLMFEGHIAGDIFPDIISQNLNGEFWNRGGIEFDAFDSHGPFALGQPYLQYEWQIDKEAYEIFNYGYVTTVDDLEQDGTARPFIDLSREKLDLGMSLLMTQRELVARNIFQREAAYPQSHVLTGGNAEDFSARTFFKFTAEKSDPRKVVYHAQNLIRKKGVGMGNAIIMTMDIYNALLTNPKLLASYENVVSGTLTHQMLAIRLKVPPENIFIAEALYNSAKKGQPRVLTDVWGNFMFVFRLDQRGVAARSRTMSQSGFTGCFKLRGWEMERVTEWRIGNAPGTLYCIQNPYNMRALDYNAAVMLKTPI